MLRRAPSAPFIYLLDRGFSTGDESHTQHVGSNLSLLPIFREPEDDTCAWQIDGKTSPSPAAPNPVQWLPDK